MTVITFKDVTFETSLKTDELDILTNKCLRKSIVVLIASKNDDKFLIYWKSNEIEHFLSFKPYNSTEMEANKILFQFIVKFLASSLNKKHLGKINFIKVRALKIHD